MPPLEKMLYGRRCQSHKAWLFWWLRAQSHVWRAPLSSGGAPGWTPACFGVHVNSHWSQQNSSTEIIGISISSVLSKDMFFVQCDWQDCHCFKGENYFASTLPVIGSILYCGKPRRTRQWKSWGLCKMRLEKWIHVASFRYLWHTHLCLRHVCIDQWEIGTFKV